MVHLILSSTKGNQGLRFFPYSGYLGLTPIRVEGVVRTKLDADQKPLLAKSITVSVRCYETRVGRVNNLHSNILVDYTKVLWAKPDALEYDHIGNLEFPFRISIPAKVAGFSTAVFVDYRCMWRVETVLNHAPLAGVGSRQVRHFELPLVRYDLPIYTPITPAHTQDEHALSQQTTKHRAPRIRYSLNTPSTSIGPLDLVSIPIHLQPVDQGVSIRSASVIIERRIQLHESSSGSSSSTPQTPISLQSSSSSSSLSKPSPGPLLHPSSYTPESYQEPPPESDPVASTSSLASSIPTITPGTVYSSAPASLEATPLLHSSSSSSSNSASEKVVVNPIAGVESSGQFARDADGVWSKTLTLQWPAAKSHSRWAVGETISSELVSVKYFIRTKIIVTSPSGTESIELADQELLVVSTNEAERQLAIAKYNEAQDSAALLESTSRSKSKSPRRSRQPERDSAIIPPSPSPGVNVPNSNSSPPTNSDPAYRRSKSSSRRPHTSAGPRDKPVNFAGGAYGHGGRPRGQQEGEASASASAGRHVVSVGGGGEASASGSGLGNGNGNGHSSTSTKRRSELVVMRTTQQQQMQRPDSSKSQEEEVAAPLAKAARMGFMGGRVSSSSFWSTTHSNGVGNGAVVAPGMGRMKGKVSGSSASTSGTASESSASVSSSSHGHGHGGGGSGVSGGREGGGTGAGERGEEREEREDHMREWEEELRRIEVKSRRSSELVGFFGKRKRVVLPVVGYEGA
ncbi:hypothetical protein B0H34DRAFT_300025 [Crassisporium funariophilum]|nr:hypothetical protein B0H34DRAFT_300025 [Crassisporium funariophilum]